MGITVTGQNLNVIIMDNLIIELTQLRDGKEMGKNVKMLTPFIFHSRVNKYCLKWKQVIIDMTHKLFFFLILFWGLLASHLFCERHVSSQFNNSFKFTTVSFSSVTVREVLILFL